jgi:hypothetical protein
LVCVIGGWVVVPAVVAPTVVAVVCVGVTSVTVPAGIVVVPGAVVVPALVVVPGSVVVPVLVPVVVVDGVDVVVPGESALAVVPTLPSPSMSPSTSKPVNTGSQMRLLSTVTSSLSQAMRWG